MGGVEHEFGEPGGVELDQPGERRVGREPPVLDVLDRGVGGDDGSPQACRADVDHENHRCSVPLGRTPLACSCLPSRPPSRPAPGHRRQGEHRREPVHVATAQQLDRDEHGLGGDVRADRRDEPVRQRKVDALHPRRATGAEHEPDQRADREPQRERVVVAAVGRPPGGDRERHREHQRTHPAPALRASRSHRDGVGHGHAGSPNGEARPSLPGLRIPFGSSACLMSHSMSNAGAECLRREAGPVETDAVVVRQVAAVGEHRPLPGVPHRDVGRLDLVGRRRRREREVEARAVDVAVGEVAAGDDGVRHGRQRVRGGGVHLATGGSTARRSPSCRRRSPCASAPARPTCRCGARASRRRACRSAGSPSASLSRSTTAIVAVTIAASPSSSTSNVHVVPSPPRPRADSAAS